MFYVCFQNLGLAIWQQAELLLKSGLQGFIIDLYELCFMCVSRIWDWQSGNKLNYCSNRASKASRITSLEFVNNHDVSLLLVGSDDGSVRLWNNNALTHSGREPILITAWQALADVQPVSRTLNGITHLYYRISVPLYSFLYAFVKYFR